MPAAVSQMIQKQDRRKEAGGTERKGGRWTIRELLLFQLVPELWNDTRVPLHASEQRDHGMKKEKNPATTVVRGIFSFLIGQTA